MLRTHLNTLRTASGLVFARRTYAGLAVATFLLAAVFYTFTLPATYTGGQVGMVSLRYLTPALAGFALVMAGLVAVIVAFTAYSLRLGASTSTTATTSGFFGSVLPPILCCSPLLPTVAAMFVGVFPGVFGVSGAVQGFIATYELEILSVATLLLVYAVLQNAKGVTRCAA
ncbi:hypothetical protein ACFQAS_15060 [Halopenitus salinus]|uniref:ABC transporter permease n=1 Tax=Halopenitus salinus TaxID=1198295 RepID=A0ABD5UPW4_9EURY